MRQRRTLGFDPIDEARRQWIDRGWQDAAGGMAALTSIIRVEQLLMARVEEALAPFELTFARYELLVLLDFSRAGALPMGKLGARLQVHPASVTNAVDRLEAQGLVERVAHPDDGRATLATITSTGRRRVRRATAVLNEAVFSDLGWSERDLRDLFRILRKLRRGAGDFD